MSNLTYEYACNFVCCIFQLLGLSNVFIFGTRKGIEPLTYLNYNPCPLVLFLNTLPMLMLISKWIAPVRTRWWSWERGSNIPELKLWIIVQTSKRCSRDSAELKTVQKLCKYTCYLHTKDNTWCVHTYFECQRNSMKLADYRWLTSFQCFKNLIFCNRIRSKSTQLSQDLKSW